MESHLLQMRGLKLYLIDTVVPAMKSHLLQMRGLKLLTRTQEFFRNASHLLQMRGLKLVFLALLVRISGRIFYRCVD
mgnify:CR=1 FL=1